MKKIFIVLIFVFVASVGFAKSANKQLKNKPHHQKYIFVDASGSMIGFIGGTYSQLLSNLDQILVIAGITFGKYSLKKIGSAVIDASRTETLSCFATDRSIYNQSQTNLVAVADYISRKLPSLALIITDSELDVRKGISMEESCRMGYDLACMGVRYGGLIVNNNYSMVVIGFKSKYKGKLYPARGKAIVLKHPIFKPVYIYIFSLPEEYKTTEKLVNEILRFLSKQGDVKYRVLRISPLIFPKAVLKDGYQCTDLFSTKSRLIYAKDSQVVSDTSLICSFTRANKMRATEELRLDIPLVIKIPNFSPVKFKNTVNILSGKENSSLIKADLGKDGLHINLPSDITRMRGKYSFVLNVNSSIEGEDVQIWRDWSTDNPKSPEYKTGRTLYISNFLEFLTRYYLNYIQTREKKIFTLILNFNND